MPKISRITAALLIGMSKPYSNKKKCPLDLLCEKLAGHLFLAVLGSSLLNIMWCYRQRKAQLTAQVVYKNRLRVHLVRPVASFATFMPFLATVR